MTFLRTIPNRQLLLHRSTTSYEREFSALPNTISKSSVVQQAHRGLPLKSPDLTLPTKPRLRVGHPPSWTAGQLQQLATLSWDRFTSFPRALLGAALSDIRHGRLALCASTGYACPGRFACRLAPFVAAEIAGGRVQDLGPLQAPSLLGQLPITRLLVRLLDHAS